MARKKTVKTTELNTEYTPLILGADETSAPSILLTMKDIADMAKSVYPEFATTIGESSTIQDSSLCVPYHKIQNSATEMYIVTSGGTSLPMDGADGHLAPITMLSSGTFEYENEQCVAKKDVQIIRASRYVYVDCENFSFANDIYIYDVSPSSATIFSKQEITFTNTKRYVIQTDAQEFKFHINVSSTTTQSIAEFNQYTHPTSSTLDSPFGGDFSYVSTGSYVTESSNETQVHGRISVTRASKQIGTFNVSKLINDTTITISGTKNSQAFVMIYSDGNLSVTDNNDSNRLVMPPTQKTVVFNTPLDNPLSYNFALSAVDGYLQDHVYIRIAEQTDTRSAAQDAMYSVSEKFKDAMKDYTWTEALAFSGTISKVGETVFLAARAKKIVPPTNINIQFGVPNDDTDIYRSDDEPVYKRMKIKTKSMDHYFDDSDNPVTISEPFMYKFQYGSNEDDIDDDEHLIFYVNLDNVMFSKIGDKISGISISGRGNKGYNTITPTSANTDCSIIYSKSFKKNEIIYIRTVAMIKLVVSWTDFTGYTVKFGDYTVTNGWSKYINTEDLNNLVFEVTRGDGSENHVKITVQGNRSQSTQWTYIEMGQSQLFSIGGVTSYNGGTVTAYFMSKNMTSVILHASMPSEKFGFIGNMMTLYTSSGRHPSYEIAKYTWNTAQKRRDYTWQDVQGSELYFQLYFSENDSVTYNGETFDHPSTIYKNVKIDGQKIYETLDGWKRSTSGESIDVEIGTGDNVTYELTTEAFSAAKIYVEVTDDTETFNIGTVNTMNYDATSGTIKNTVSFNKNSTQKEMTEANYNLPIMLWKFSKGDNSPLAHYLYIRAKVGNYTYPLTHGDDIDPGKEYQLVDNNGIWISSKQIDEAFHSHFEPFSVSENGNWNINLIVKMLKNSIINYELSYDKEGTEPVGKNDELPIFIPDDSQKGYSFVAKIQLVNTDIDKNFSFECGYISDNAFKRGNSPYNWVIDTASGTSQMEKYVLSAPQEQDFFNNITKILSYYTDRQYAIRVTQSPNVDEIVIPLKVQPVILMYIADGETEKAMPSSGTKEVTFTIQHFINTMGSGHKEVGKRLNSNYVDITVSSGSVSPNDFDIGISYNGTVATMSVAYIGSSSSDYTIDLTITEPTIGTRLRTRVTEAAFSLYSILFIDNYESYLYHTGSEEWTELEKDEDNIYLIPGNSGIESGTNQNYLRFVFKGTNETVTVSHIDSFFKATDSEKMGDYQQIKLSFNNPLIPNTLFNTKRPSDPRNNITGINYNGETYTLSFTTPSAGTPISVKYKFESITRLYFDSAGGYTIDLDSFINNGIGIHLLYPRLSDNTYKPSSNEEPNIDEADIFMGFTPEGSSVYDIECLDGHSPFGLELTNVTYNSNGFHQMYFSLSLAPGKQLTFDLYVIKDNAIAKLSNITVRRHI